MEQTERAPLVVRFRGPGVRNGRLLLTDLVQFGRQLQTAVDRVARVLEGQASTAPGRRSERIRSACALEVVAISRGSFELAIDFRREQMPFAEMDLGEAALEKLVSGLDTLVRDGEVLPPGYDVGVLAAWREAGRLFDHGLEAVDLHLRTSRGYFDVVYDSQVHARVAARIKGPVQSLRTIEGRLMMADFKELGRRCRVHPPVGPPVEIEFEESLADAVYDNLRSSVRVTGEAEEDPHTGRIRLLRLRDIEPLALETGVESFSPEDFWQEPTIEQLAAEQSLRVPQAVDNMVGAAADLWESDEEFLQFVACIYERRREGAHAPGDLR